MAAIDGYTVINNPWTNTSNDSGTSIIYTSSISNGYVYVESESEKFEKSIELAKKLLEKSERETEILYTILCELMNEMKMKEFKISGLIKYRVSCLIKEFVNLEEHEEENEDDMFVKKEEIMV